MEEGTKSKKTIFVGGIGDDVDEAVLYEKFATFGWIITFLDTHA
jgi:peptidyl-prolyl isomerase E (cyclophilin E)